MSNPNNPAKFHVVRNPKSWVWYWYMKNDTHAQCTVCSVVSFRKHPAQLHLCGKESCLSLRYSESVVELRIDIKGASLVFRMKGLEEHAIDRDTDHASQDQAHDHGAYPSPGSCRTDSEATAKRVPLLKRTGTKDSTNEEESEGVIDLSETSPCPKKKRQAPLNTFLIRKHGLKDDMLRLVTVSNTSMNQIVSDETTRRLLCRAYPGDPPPPKSIATLRRLLSDEASQIREEVSTVLRNILAKGF